MLAAFVALCAAAAGASAASFVGRAEAVFVGLLSAALLASLARKTSARRVPCALLLEPGTGMLAAYDRSGRRVAHGAVVRCMHWADRLLVLEIACEHGRPVPFLVPADAIAPRVFRALSVFGRRAGRD
ncbi:RNA polymerase subunit sigma [Burkholderia sp. Ac-20379]|uniref:RNA polymerase subunit sigma n=1 Tax=Burkholderia sp. Ac-20379 TaxID=2703900 RepID=UPI0030DC4620